MNNLWRSRQILLTVSFLFSALILTSCDKIKNEKDPVTVNVNAQGTGKGIIRSTPVGIDCDKTCKATFDHDSGQITLTAEPATDSIFVEWQGACQGNGACTVNSTSDHSIVAVFDIKPIPMINITVTRSGDGNGSVVSAPAGIDCGSSCQAQFQQNTTLISLTASANSDSVFVGWQGDCQGTAQCLLESNVDHTVNAVFNVKPAINVESISLINADTDLAIAEYDPLLSNTVLDLASLPTRNLNLSVNTTPEVESVEISVNGSSRVENIIPYSLNDINGNFSKWPLTLGTHTIVVTPYSQDNTQGNAGESQTLVLTLSEAKWTFSTDKLNFASSPGGGAASAKTIILNNTGNLDLNYSVNSIPSWLSVSPNTGRVVENASATIQFQPAACTVDGRDEATVTVTAGTLTQTLSIVRACSSTANIDFELERFYISQSVPAMDSKQPVANQVSLVKGRAGLARAFVTVSENSAVVPDVVLNYRLPDGTTGSVNLSAPGTVPLETQEGQLDTTFTSDLAKTFLVPGIEIYIEVDPDKQFLELDETNNRLPAAGYYSPTVLDIKTFNITIVPITYNGELAGDMSTARIKRLLEASWKMHPMSEIDIVVHDPIASTASWGGMLDEVDSLRTAEGSSRAYHGIVRRGPPGGTSGIGYVGHLAAVSQPYSGTIAHELGHNFGLPHAPCGGPARPDPNFPYRNARTGVWGYDLLNKILKAPTLADLMSYCNPTWISDYNYKKVSSTLNRVRTLQVNQFQQSEIQPVLLVRGSVKSETLSIDSVFSLSTKVLETEEGPYLLRGLNEAGDELFRQSFKPYALSHEPLSHFAVNVPTDTTTLAELHSLEISSNEQILLKHRAIGSSMSSKNQQMRLTQAIVTDSKNDTVQITWDKSRYHAVMVRDLDSKQVLGLDKSGRLTVYTKSDQVEVIYSNGLTSSNEILTIGNNK